MKQNLKKILLYAFISSITYLLGLTAVVLYFGRDLPPFEQLEKIRPKLITTIHSSDGHVLKKFAEQKRALLPYEKIPPEMIDAVIAVEDRRFWDHWGVSMRDIIRAALTNLKTRKFKQGAHGASTLTQQLSKNLFLTPEVSWSRKIREAITAIRIERTYTKKEILQMYLNQVFFGHGAWGVESAARFFFSKSAEELSLGESALLAGLLKAPNRYSPINNPEKARQRRDSALDAMGELKKISKMEAEATKKLPLGLNPKVEEKSEAPYFVEHIRQQLESRYGAKAIYQDGLSVYTTLDSRLQEIAEEALLSRLSELQKSIDKQRPKETTEDSSKAALDTSAAFLRTKVVQGALVALNPHNGRILAMVGGRDFEESKFNRATQALRQPGSAFKPFVYTAAIDNGWRPTDQILDTAISIPMPDGTIWDPENYDKEFRGLTTLREGLKRSINMVAIRLLREMGGPRWAIQYAHKMGIKTPLQPVLSLAVGTSEVRLLDLTSAYGVFPNKGIRVEPISILRIVDKDGNTIYEQDKGVESEALSAETAAMMTDMLRSVMEEGGTGQRARWYGFNRPAGGKTGTTGKYADAWFIGFTPQIVAGVWIGFDEKIPLGKEHQSGAVVALPVWARFMKEAHESLNLPVEDFQPPPGVVRLQVCGDTYQIASDYCPNKLDELFIRGTEPTELCPLHQQTTPGEFKPNSRETKGLRF